MDIYFGTVVRSAPVRDGGELVRLDWDAKRVVKRVSVAPENPNLDHDPNPRGNTRGVRGVQIRGENSNVAYHLHRAIEAVHQTEIDATRLRKGFFEPGLPQLEE